MWQLLERVPDRCGPMLPLGVTTTGLDHWVQVPSVPDGEAVVARFQLSLGWFSSVEAVVFKPPGVYIRYNDQRPSRFVAATAPDLHLIRPASTLGYYSGFMPTSLSRLRFSIVGASPTATGVKVSFYRIHVAPLGGGNGEVLPPLLTRVLRPANGAAISGVKVLDAGATDYFKIDKVEFHLTGVSEQDTVIATGGRTIFGWLALWNTAEVANGVYALRTVAYDSAGRTSQSKSIVVVVKN